jgi:hypothetical protein
VLVCAQSPTGAVEAAKWVIGVQAQCPSIVKVPVTIVRVLETEEVKQEEAEAWSYPRD